MISEKDLIIKAQSGDNGAESILFKNYQYLVGVIANKFNNISYRDGLVSDGSLGLLNAIRSYNPDSNKASFKTYASTCIRNCMLDGIRTNSPVDVLDESHDAYPDLVFNESTFNDDYSARELIAEIKKILSENEFSVFLLYIQEYSYKDIAERLNITQKKVDNLIQSSKRKARDLLTKLKS